MRHLVSNRQEIDLTIKPENRLHAMNAATQLEIKRITRKIRIPNG